MTNFSLEKKCKVLLFSTVLVFLYLFPDALRHLAMAPGYHQTTANLVQILRTSTLFFLFLFFLFFSGFGNAYQSMCISRLRFMFLIFIFFCSFLVLYFPFFLFFCVALTLSLCYVKKEVVRKQRQLLKDVWRRFQVSRITG